MGACLLLTLALLGHGAEGRHITVWTMLNAPFMMKVGENDYAGYEVDVWNALFAEMRLVHPDLTFSFNTTGSVNQVINKTSHDVDALGLAMASITPDRLRHVDFSFSYFTSGIDAAVKKPEEKFNPFQFFDPLGPWVWVTMIVATMFSGHVIWFLESAYQPRLFPKTYFLGVNEGIWWCWGVLTGTVQNDIIGFPTRMYSVGWALLSIIIVSAYTASFATILTLSQLDVGPTSFNQLQGTRVGVVEDTRGYYWVRDNLQATPVLFPSFDEAFSSLDAYAIDAFVYDASVLVHAISSGNSEIRVMGKMKTEEEYGIALHQDSEFTELINSLLLQFRSTGVLADMHSRWFSLSVSSGTASLTADDIAANASQLTVTGAAGILLLLLFSLIASISSWILINLAQIF